MGLLSFIITASLFVISLVRTRKCKHKLFNPIVIFLGLWSLILFLSILNLYNITYPSNDAYLLILLMNILFFLGSLTADTEKVDRAMRRFSNFARKKIKSIRIRGISKRTLLRIIYLVLIISIVLNIIDCIIAMSYLSQDVPLWQIRNWSLEPFGSSNPILDRRGLMENIFRQIIMPVSNYIIGPVAIYMLFNGDSRKNKYLPVFLFGINLVVSSFAGGGGRLGFIMFAAYCLFAYKKYRIDRYKKTNKKTVATILLAILALLALVSITTAFRVGVGNLFKQAYTYFALAPTLLSLWLPTLSVASPTFGMLTTFGLHSYLFRGMKMIGMGSLVPAAFDNAFQTMLDAEAFLNVGYGQANAFVSPVYYFFADGGWVFVCLASFIFGFLICRAYNRMESSDYDVRNFVLYCMIMYGVLVSFMRVQTVIPAYVIALALVAFLPSKDREKRAKGRG